MNKQDERTNLTLGFLRMAYKDYIAVPSGKKVTKNEDVR
jgi:hypothetical protein